MKLPRFFIIILTTITMISCSSDDVRIPTELDGNWMLEKIDGGVLDVNIEFQADEVSWDFDFTSREVRIINTIPEDDPRISFSGFPTGLYSFEFRKLQDALLLYVEGVQLGFLRVTDSGFIVKSRINNQTYNRQFVRIP